MCVDCGIEKRKVKRLRRENAVLAARAIDLRHVNADLRNRQAAGVNARAAIRRGCSAFVLRRVNRALARAGYEAI